ncbi:MAG TPA: ATP-binding protein [Bacteroidia bacterium]|nr:ATP-binding protein [Bacteroidia bacterium]
MPAKRKRLSVIPAFIVLLFCGTMNAQAGTEEFRARLFPITSNDGLSQGFVSSMVQDHRGFIWFATKDGLNRYDGYSYKIYRHDPDDPFSVADNIVLNIFEDSRGYLWISTPHILQVFDPVSEKFTPVPLLIGGKDYGAPAKIAEDHSGNMWGRASGELVYLRLEKHPGKDDSSFAEKYTVTPFTAESVFGKQFVKESGNTNFFTDAEGDFWVTDSETVYYSAAADLAAGRITAKYSQPEFCGMENARIIGASADTVRHTMTFISTGGFSVYDTKTDKLLRTVPFPLTDITSFNAVAGDELGNAWVSTTTGVFIYSDSTRLVRKFMPLNIDSTVWNTYIIRSLLVDRGGIVWMGANGFGVFKYNPRVSFFHLVDQPGISLIRGTHDGRIFISIRGDLFSFDPVACKKGAPAFREKNFAQTFNGEQNFPQDFQQDAGGTFWLSYGHGTIGKYDEKSGKISFFRLAVPGRDFEARGRIWLDPENNPWISAECGEDTYIARFNAATGTFDITAQVPGKKVNWMYTFVSDAFTDAAGNTWIGTTEGLYCYSVKTGQWKSYKNIPGNKSSLSSDIIFSVCPDPHEPTKFIWVGTGSGGLNCLDVAHGTFAHFTDKDGLPNNVVYAVVPDGAGNLWLSTNHGLCRFSVQAHTCKNYFASDGLQGNEFNRYVYYAADDGALYFGGVNGMNFFYPAALGRSAHPPQLVFTELRLFNREMIPGDSGSVISKPIDFVRELVLPYDQNVITIGFAAMDFSAPEKNQFRYKLEGFDKDWIFSGTRNEAIYTGLAPGDYRLLVTTANSEGTWSAESRVIHIVIRHPWWKTWWATALFIFLGAWSVGMIILLRTKSLQRSRKILEEKVSERTRELDETITNLRNTQKQLIKNEKLASFGQLTAGIAHEIKNPLNFINNFSELSNELIEELKLASTDEERNEIMLNLQNNIEKISFHGHRVDSIIRSMLNHSRTAGARRQPTDINKLCGEFSNLAYHSMRANVQDFSCSLKSDYGKNIPELMVIPQDISRVLLNLLNNAFYAVNEKRKTAGADYKPEVKISTRMQEEKVVISIRDNGSGIPAELMDKLFDPFFTTKPAGEGTGLGLSITYDIIHSHGGKISVDSKAGEFTEFTIHLPVRTNGTAGAPSLKE